MRYLLAICLTVFVMAISQQALADNKDLINTDRDKVYSDCANDPIENAYRDCRCYADNYEKFLLKNIGKPPEYTFMQVERTCFDTKEVYYFEFSRCMERIQHGLKQIDEDDEEDFKEMCDCLASYMKEELEDYIDIAFKKYTFSTSTTRRKGVNQCEARTPYGRKKHLYK